MNFKQYNFNPQSSTLTANPMFGIVNLEP